MFMLKEWLLVQLLPVIALGSSPLEPVGEAITLEFPNDQQILGVGGLGYDAQNDLWFASSESLESRATSSDEDFNLSLPRFYQMKLNFFDKEAPIEFLLEEPVFVQTDIGLKFEDLAVAPESDINDTSYSGNRDIWLASESHSHIATTSKFLSKDFGPPDLSSFDRQTFAPSRLLRVDGATGEILEEATLPPYVYWDLEYDWQATSCVGERPFAGLHALSIVSSNREDYSYIMFAAFQTALYQDGNSPNEFSEGATRVLMYGLTPSKEDDRKVKTASYIKSFRYDTSKLSLNKNQFLASHFNALFGILALNETSLLVAECEDLTSVGDGGQKIINRIYYIDLEDTVDHCKSLLSCDVGAPLKRLIWESDGNLQLDGMAWGPSLQDGRRSVALTFENDEEVGVHFELYALNESRIDTYGDVYISADTRNKLLQDRIIATSTAIVLLILFVVAQIIYIRRLENNYRNNDDSFPVEVLSRLNYSNYALASAMLNSFLIGGLTFGYSGMVLMLRNEGVYADNCSCGSYCSSQKEQLALVSSVGFATAIGSRLFIGIFLDVQGPKLTSIICSFISLCGFCVLASSSENQLTSNFLPAWILISLGGSGLHISGFHFTNLFPGDGKKRASAFISAAFGASSVVFPIMQLFNQYAGVPIHKMMAIYAALAGLILANNFLIQPWSKLQKGESFIPNFKIFTPCWWNRDIGQKPTFANILEDAITFDFLGEATIYSILLLLLTHYLSTSSQLLYEKGDIPFTSNPNDWSDYILAKMAGWFNALGVIFLPTVKFLLTKLRWPQLFSFLCVINLLVVGIVLTNSLELQIFGFTMLSFGRLMLFSCHHAYLIDTFGMKTFGTLNGISSFLAAILGLCSYPLQLFALGTSYAISFIPIGVLVILSFCIPFFQWKKSKDDEVKRRNQINIHEINAHSFGTDFASGHNTFVDLEETGHDERLAIRKRQEVTVNWAETVSVDPAKFCYPTSIDEVVSLVNSNKKIRCAGALHSCAPLILSEGIIMSLTKLQKIINIDTESMTVRCQAGTRIYNICDAVAPYNMALGTLGTIDWQTIAGAVMTGTHGGALTVPSLHTFVNSYTLVKANGKITTITRKSDPLLFSAIAPSMGLLGVVVEMEIQCVPLETLEARMDTIEFDQLIEVFESVVKTNKYARIVVYPNINKATIWVANPVSSRREAIDRGAVNSPSYTNFRNDEEKELLEEYLLYCERGLYKKADILLEEVLSSQVKRLQHYVGQYHHVLCKERNNGIPHADIEFNFDLKKYKQVLTTVKKFCNDERVPYYNFEIRTTKQDNAMLSCCKGRDSMWIDFQAKADVSKDFFDKVESLLQPIGFRKHWAKGLNQSNPESIMNQFNDMKKFLLMMKELDPDGKFRNIASENWFRIMNAAAEEDSCVDRREKKQNATICKS